MGRSLRFPFYFLLINFFNLALTAQTKIPEELNNTLVKISNPIDSIQEMLAFADQSIQSDPKLSQSLIDQSKQIAQKINDKTLLAEVEFTQAKLYRNHGRHNDALELLLPLLDTYSAMGEKVKLGTSSRIAGDLYMRLGQYDEAKPLFESCIPLFEELKDTSNLGFTYRGLSSLARRKGDYAGSLNLGLQAMDYFKAINHSDGIANMHNSLGILYSQMNDYDNARGHFQSSLDMAIAGGSKTREANGYRSLAFVTENDEEKRIELYKKSLTINQELGRNRNIANDHFDLGVSNKYLGRLDEALHHYQEAETIFKEAKLPMHNRLVMAIGEIQVLLDNPDAAMPYLEKGLQMAKDAGDADDLSTAYGLLAKVHSSMNDYKTAYDFKVLHKQLDDSLISVDKNRQIAEMETTYKVKEKDLEIGQLEQTRALQQRTIIFGIVGLLLLSLLAFNLWKTSQNRKKTNQLLSQQKAEIESRNEENETLLKEIHHRVKNNLQVISALLTLQSKYIQDKSAIEALREGQDRVQSMALIHKDLYQQNNLKGVNIRDYFEKLIDNLLESYKIDEGDIVLTLDVEPIWLDVDTMIPMGLLVNELISNALKHAFEGQSTGEIYVHLKELDNQLVLRVADNGKGVTDLSIIESKSFGYSLIKSFAKRMDADLSFHTEDGFGVELRIKNYEKAEPDPINHLKKAI